MKNKLSFLLTALLAMVTYWANAASTAAPELPGKRDSLYSNILKEKRVIQVIMPEKYKPGSAEKYDVLYLLDGESNASMAQQIQQFVEQETFMPPSIIVAIHNTDRNKDFTPSRWDKISTSGGAKDFLAFLKNELMPYVDKNYPTNGDNTLFGHSFGGLFGMYAFLTEPALFQSYLLADPSFWWDNQFMQKMAKEKLDTAMHLNQSLFITGREGKGYAGMGITAMDSILRTKAPASLHWKSVAYPDETHGSVKFKTMYDGLKYTYSGYGTSIQFHPMNGTVVKGKPIKIWCFSEYPSIRYTINGSQPTAASPKMEREITLAEAGQLNVRAISYREKHDKTASGYFKSGEVLKAAAKPAGVKPGGLRYKYYEGEWDKLPDFKKLKPVQTGLTDQAFSLTKLPRQTNFSLVVEGYLEIKEEGYYIFGLNSDDGSRLYLKNELLIDYDGLHGSNDPRSYVIPLEKGFYPIRLEYFQKGGGQNLDLVYVLPATKDPQPTPIPLELQYSR